MSDNYYFLDVTEDKIQNHKFLVIYVLNINKHVVFRIFKLYSDDLLERLSYFKQFDEISDRITFAIKRDGKITLDINI